MDRLPRIGLPRFNVPARCICPAAKCPVFPRFSATCQVAALWCKGGGLHRTLKRQATVTIKKEIMMQNPPFVSMKPPKRFTMERTTGNAKDVRVSELVHRTLTGVDTNMTQTEHTTTRTDPHRDPLKLVFSFLFFERCAPREMGAPRCALQ